VLLLKITVYNELLALLVLPLPRRQVLLEAVDGLRRRSLIERGMRSGSFTLQSVVLEYITKVLIEEGSREIQQHQLNRLIQYGLSQAMAREYVRQTQERLLVTPLLAALQGVYPRQVDEAWQTQGTVPTASVEEQLLGLLGQLRKEVDDVQGYGPANMIALLRAHRGHLRSLDLSHLCIRWSPDGRFLASSGRDNAIRLWDPATGECLHVLQDPDYADTMFYGVAWSPDGRLLACGSYVCGVQVWDMATRTHCWVGQHSTCVRRVAWSPDGTQLAGSGDDGDVYLWKASDGTLLRRLQGHRGRVMSVDWSPDGKQLASAGDGRDGGELWVWDTGGRKASPHGEPVQTLRGHSGSVFTVAWSPNGTQLVSGDSDGTIRWWKVSSGDCLRICKGHEGGVRSLRVSPDGRLLASSGNDGTIRVWNLQSAELLHTLRHDRPYERLNISGIKGLNKAEIASLQALGAIDEAVS
jgi:hypothetical protein